jgi:hypothetical protein
MLKLEQYSDKYNFLISLIIGFFLVFFIIPLPILTANVHDWHTSVNPDYGMTLNGFLYFWVEPWHFPIFAVDGLGIPFGYNIFYTDSYPLAAFFAKLLPLASAPNIYPACLALSIILQTAAGSYFARACGLRGPAALLAGGFFTFTPFFLFRFGHIALLNHWILLIGLAEVVRNRPGFQGRLLLLSSLAFLTHAYLWAMLFPLFLGATLRAALAAPAPPKILARDYLLGLGLMIGLAYGIGLIGQGLTPLPPDNFGQASLNLLSPFIPQRSGIFPGQGILDATGLQYEGFAYLGVGSLGLLLAAVLVARRPYRWPRWADLGLPALLALFLIYAVSNKVYIGNYLILSIDLPPEWLQIVAQFRNSGRFFWPVGYALVGYSLFIVNKRLRPVPKYGLLLTLLALQIIDAGPMLKTARHEMGDRRTPLIDAATWERHFAHSERLIIAPPFGCAPIEDWPVIVDLQNLAAQNHIPINSLYAARALKTCDEGRDATLAGPPVAGTTYALIGAQTGQAIRAALPCAPLRVPRQTHKLWLPQSASGETEVSICRAGPP